MATMIVVTTRVFKVDYHGDQYRQHALEVLQGVQRESEGAGPAGSHVTTEVTRKGHPQATCIVQVVHDTAWSA